MMSGGLLRVTVTVCAVIAVVVATGAVVLGHAVLGVAFAAGVMLGSLNGYVIQTLMVRGAPFRAASLMRLVAFSSVALIAALLLREIAWSFPLGIGVAQLVMVGAGVRQGLRA